VTDTESGYDEKDGLTSAWGGEWTRLARLTK